jgi:hypothetical protein
MNDSEDDDWTGSMKRPWLNPPMKHDLNTSGGSWRYVLAVIVVAVIAVIVVLVLVGSGHLARGWAYGVLPVAIIAAAATRVLTAFKVGAEDKSGD